LPEKGDEIHDKYHINPDGKVASRRFDKLAPVQVGPVAGIPGTNGIQPGYTLRKPVGKASPDYPKEID